MASYAGPARLRSPVSISSCEENVRSILCTGELKCHISRHTSCLPHMFIYSFYFICVYSFFSWPVRLGFRVLKYPRSGLLLTAQDWLASVVNFSRNIEKLCGFVFCYAMLCRFEARTDFNFAYCSTDDSPVVLAVLATWLSWKLGTNSAQGIALLDCSTGSPLRSCQCLSVSVRSVSMLEFGFQRDRNSWVD